MAWKRLRRGFSGTPLKYRVKPLLFLVPAAFGMTFAASLSPATLAAGKAAIVAALKDPLNLMAQRSPGERGAGTLLLTKPNRGPHERVLSGVRERPPAAGAPPGESALPGSGTEGPAAGNAPPGSAASPEQIFGAPSPASFQGPLGGGTPFGFFPPTSLVPGGPPASNTTGAPPAVLPDSSVPAAQQIPASPPGELPSLVADTPPAFMPPGLTPPSDTLPTDTLPAGPPATPIPEPATWLMLLLGLFAVFGSTRRLRKPDGPGRVS